MAVDPSRPIRPLKARRQPKDAREKNADRFGAFPQVHEGPLPRHPDNPIPLPPKTSDVLNMSIIAQGTVETGPRSQYAIYRLLDDDGVDWVLISQEFLGEGGSYVADSGVMLKGTLLEDVVRKIGLCMEVDPADVLRMDRDRAAQV